METLRKGFGRSMPVLTVALALLAAPAGQARGQFGGFGYGYPGYGYGGFGYPGFGMAGYGSPMLGYGYGNPGLGFGYGGLGYGGYGMGYGGYGMGYGGYGMGYGMGFGGLGYGMGYGGLGYGYGMGYGGYGYGSILPYANAWVGSYVYPPIMPGLWNPLFGVGTTPLGLQSALAERYVFGRGTARTVPGYTVPPGTISYTVIPARPVATTTGTATGTGAAAPATGAPR